MQSVSDPPVDRLGARHVSRRVKAREIDIPNPCNEDWDAMTPAERGRFCAACQQTVHDLSAMSEEDARALLRTEDDICVSYVSDARGDVQFEPPPVVPLARLVRRASAASAAGLSLALAACAPHGDGPRLDETAESERPAFLEVQPSIPDAEPCDSTPEAPAVSEPSPKVHRRTGGTPRPRKKGNIKRLGGKPAKPVDRLPGL